MKIRFTKDVWLNKDDRAKKPSFPEGSSHDMNKASAYRWVRRDVAVYIVENVVKPPVLKMDRPMMGSSDEIREAVLRPSLATAVPLIPMTEELLEDAPKPKKRGRKSKPKQDTATKLKNPGPALPVKGSGTNGGPGWDSV